MRKRRNGDPSVVMPHCFSRKITPEKLLGRWNAHVSKEGHPQGCWLWTGKLHVSGYGYLSNYKGSNLAHRIGYELLVRPLLSTEMLDHTCHNDALECLGGTVCLHRRCVNPSHVEVVTRSENSSRGEARERAAQDALAEIRKAVGLPYGASAKDILTAINVKGSFPSPL